jgi:L-ascorbate metabolism protein UlaG (beta-lactamase superfamily)
LSRLTWLGHSTVVVDLDETRVVTDPVLRARVWHLRREDEVTAASLGRLDAILISHVHFDHLDLRSLGRLDRHLPLVVPRGAGSLVRRRGFGQVVELEVGEEVEIGAIRIRATPADHSSGRGPFSAKTAALGFLLEGTARVYFAGDTDLFSAMSELAPVSVALLPVAGWGPRLGPGHLDPARAAEALRLLRPGVAVPIHWGTFRTLFADSAGDGPAREFARLAGALAPEVDVRILSIGETLALEAVS